MLKQNLKTIEKIVELKIKNLDNLLKLFEDDEKTTKIILTERSALSTIYLMLTNNKFYNKMIEIWLKENNENEK